MSKQLAKPNFKHQTRKRNSFPWEVAVYSTTSVYACRDLALKVLRHYKVPATKITVFVPDGQKKQYSAVLKTGTYNSVIETNGSMDVFINDHYTVGTPVIYIKDTVRGFLETGSRLLKSLFGVIQTGFQECEKQGAHLWGIYPHAIASLLRPTISKELKAISSCFFGCISLGSQFIQFQVPETAEFERSILFFQRDGVMLRLNFVAAFCSQDGRPNASAKRQLAKVYPDYVRLVNSKKGTLEIRLRTPERSKTRKND